MNGKEFVSTVRKNERLKHIPIIMLTSDEDIDVEVELLNLGADAFVSKSKDPRILAAQIKRVSRERNQRVAA
jgi:two-component system NtrC family sensor kinase